MREKEKKRERERERERENEREREESNSQSELSKLSIGRFKLKICLLYRLQTCLIKIQDTSPIITWTKGSISD